MANAAINFNFIPNNLLIPGFFFEVQPANNSGLQQFTSLLVGQVLSTGSLGPITAGASAPTSSGATLHFSSTPTNIVPGMQILDLTTPSVIAAGATVVSTTGTTVVMSAAVTSGGVLTSDRIQFSFAPAPILVNSWLQAKGLFGVGSMLANQVNAYRLNDNITPLYCLPLLDDPNSVAATGSITIVGTVSSNTVIFLYVAGTFIPVAVTAAMSAANIATAISNNINAVSDLPLTASPSSTTVNLTARNAGVEGNNIDVRLNYHGTANGETTPSGLTITIVPMASGAVNPSLTAPLAALGDKKFDVISAPYTDSNSLGSFESFLNDDAGRWGPLGPQLFGHYFCAANNTVGSLTTLAEAQNSQHVSILGLHRSPTPCYALSAALAANAAVSTQADVGLPWNTLQLNGCLTPQEVDDFLAVDRQTLLEDGISTARADPARNLIIDRTVTTYTTNDFDQADDSFQNAEEMFCIAYGASYMASLLSSQFARAKLAQDGTRIPVGSGIVTPNVIRGAVIAIYGNLVSQGVMQGFDQFAQNVIAQINATNLNRVDVYAPIQPINQLDVTAIALQLVL